MGSELHSPGPSGPAHIAAPVARAWAVAAATAAVRVPAGNAEADAWTVRGWADVAIGCVALDGPGFIDPAQQDGPGAFSGLDEVIRSLRVVSQHDSPPLEAQVDLVGAVADRQVHEVGLGVG